MSTFVPPWSARRWQEFRQWVGRIPLRVKLITAVLALVAIALAVISTVSIALFRDYQLRRANQQVITLYQQALTQANAGHGLGPTQEPTGQLYAGSFLIAMQPEGSSLPSSPGTSIPDIPTSPAWLSANSGKLVDVPSVTGTDKWRVITKLLTYQGVDPLSGQVVTQRETLIAGVDLGDINGTIGRLAYIDMIVSIVVVAALAIVGIAIVRTSLRPLTEIEHTAQAIAAGDLSRRVPEHDPRTEVGRLGRALNAMLAQIESAFRARERSEASARRSEERMRQFVADASHELRTPLTAIRGYAEYYRQRGGLVEDMLVLARLDEQRPIERRPVDLLTLAADAVQDARIVAPSRAIDLTVGTGTAFLVLGDEARLRQVISNLMSNALTHTPEGSPISVRILAGQQAGDPPVPSAVLEVTDHGPGLTPEQASRVFERFYRADQARGRQTGGSGLGLAIVEALVAAHDGTVSVDTAPGHGATFRITLPLAPEALTTELVAD